MKSARAAQVPTLNWMHGDEFIVTFCTHTHILTPTNTLTHTHAHTHTHTHLGVTH